MPGLTTSKQFAFIDRKKSKYDLKRMKELEKITIDGKEEEIPVNGQYFFTDKRKVYKLKNGTKISPYWFRWVAETPHRLSYMQMTKEYEFVKRTDDIVPEGMAVNADGNYQYVDLILMRRPLERYLIERMAMGKEPGKQKQAVVNKFKANAHKFALDINDKQFEEELAKMLGDDFE